MVDPKEIQLPAAAPAFEKVVWRDLFKYPRSVTAGCLAGLSGTGITGFLLWQVTLFVMVLHVTPAEASGLVIWLSLGQVVGRFLCSWISDAMGRRASIALTCAIAGVTMSLAGYCNDLFLGGVSLFYLLIMVQQFFGSSSYSIIGPHMAEIWPSRLRQPARSRPTPGSRSAKLAPSRSFRRRSKWGRARRPRCRSSWPRNSTRIGARCASPQPGQRQGLRQSSLPQPAHHVGSFAGTGYYETLRLAGAQARAVLLASAAELWNVPAAEITTEPGIAVHAKSGRRIGYGDLAKTAKVPDPLPQVSLADLKTAAQFRLIGNDVRVSIRLPRSTVRRNSASIRSFPTCCTRRSSIRP